jgi:uncharacterized protein YecE (DUF72 family)
MMGNATYYIGTSGWNYDHWYGIFYPSDQPKTRKFEYYATQFNTVEVNATFYRTFKESTFKKWYNNAPEGFKYVLKVPRFISHRKNLNDVDQESIDRFVDSARILKEKLGVLLLQLRPGAEYDPDGLKNLLSKFGSKVRVAVEFRDDKWFTDDVEDLLNESNAVFCDADSPKTSTIGWITSDAAYIRLHGRDEWYDYNYSEKELNEIAELSKNAVSKRAKEVYIFFNNDSQGFAPKNALRLKDLLSVDK